LVASELKTLTREADGASSEMHACFQGWLPVSWPHWQGCALTTVLAGGRQLGGANRQAAWSPGFPPLRNSILAKRSQTFRQDRR
jgi:hypothetical protein